MRIRSEQEPGGGRGFGRVEELVHDGMESLFRVLHHFYFTSSIQISKEKSGASEQTQTQT